MPKKRKVRNIAELAEIAGVSASTVSRALSGKGVLSEKTRAHVQALAKEHDFRPSILARNLRTQRTGAIGVIIPLGHEEGQHISDPFFMTMIGYLADALTERGYDLLLSKVIPDSEAWLEDLVDLQRTDGLMIIGQSDQYDVLENVAATYLPMVVWGGNRPNQIHCAIGSNNRLGGELATTHLIDRGCSKIVFLGDPMAVEIRQRLNGCKTICLEKTGIEPLVHPIHIALDGHDSGLVSFLRSHASEIDGIFAATDGIAMKALQAIAEAGLSVPGDISLVGYDDLPIATQTVPPLTTVRQDIRQGATFMVERLFERIEGIRTPSVMLNPELVIRKST